MDGPQQKPPIGIKFTAPIPQRYVNRKRTWMNRYPRAFISITTTGLLLILFSRPLYDAFIVDVPLNGPPPKRTPLTPPKLSEVFK